MERLLKKLHELAITATTIYFTSSKRNPKMKKVSFRVEVGVEDIVFEILTWLPAKSLMRFKCVCKAWNTLIRHDPYFVKSHYAHSQVRPSAYHLLFQLIIYPDPITSSPTQVERFSLQLVRHHSPIIDICSNHCNGLVCFYTFYHSVVYLYNVTTGEMKALPFCPIRKKWDIPRFFLGFDPLTEKYKLLHVFTNYKGRPRIHILTLGTNSWREIELIPENSSPEYFSRYCIFLNGVLYWTKRYNDPMDYFDFREEKFGILSAPADGLREKLVSYWSSFRHRYKKRLLISDEVNKVLMRYNFDDPNSEKVVALVEAARSDSPKFVLATTSLIGAPSTLLFPSHVRLRDASSFVENIIPLTFIDI